MYLYEVPLVSSIFTCLTLLVTPCLCSAEDRREYLESLLRECKKDDEVAPVLDDEALNYVLARRLVVVKETFAKWSLLWRETAQRFYCSDSFGKGVLE